MGGYSVSYFGRTKLPKKHHSKLGRRITQFEHDLKITTVFEFFLLGGGGEHFIHPCSMNQPPPPLLRMEGSFCHRGCQNMFSKKLTKSWMQSSKAEERGGGGGGMQIIDGTSQCESYPVQLLISHHKTIT